MIFYNFLTNTPLICVPHFLEQEHQRCIGSTINTKHTAFMNIIGLRTSALRFCTYFYHSPIMMAIIFLVLVTSNGSKDDLCDLLPNSTIPPNPINSTLKTSTKKFKKINNFVHRPWYCPVSVLIFFLSILIFLTFWTFWTLWTFLNCLNCLNCFLFELFEHFEHFEDHLYMC